MNNFKIILTILSILLFSINLFAGDTAVKVCINPLLKPSLNIDVLTPKYSVGVDFGTYLGGGSMFQIRVAKYKDNILYNRATTYYGLLLEKYSYEASWPYEEKGTYITPMVFGGYIMPFMNLFVMGVEFGAGYPIIQSIEPDDDNYENRHIGLHVNIFFGIKLGGK
jgi:hypothetical protein